MAIKFLLMNIFLCHVQGRKVYQQKHSSKQIYIKDNYRLVFCYFFQWAVLSVGQLFPHVAPVGLLALVAITVWKSSVPRKPTTRQSMYANIWRAESLPQWRLPPNKYSWQDFLSRKAVVSKKGPFFFLSFNYCKRFGQSSSSQYVYEKLCRQRVAVFQW